MNLQLLLRKKTISSLQQQEKETNLKKVLSVWDITAFGIAAIIGAGIFATIGNAAAAGGPAISLLFVFTAIACGFSGLCYAQFASSVPTSGSAYTYAYVALGELFAWIIGWDLLLEYAIGNIAVAISWSDYFTGFLKGIGLHIPEYLTTDFLTAKRGYAEAAGQLAGGVQFDQLSIGLQDAWLAWSNAPGTNAFRLVLDLPALLIVTLITIIVFRGIRESRTASNIMVGIKLVVIAGVIILGSFYVNPGNWSPFAPNGFGGVMKGVAAVFFAYIGFDAISTTTEECKNPKRDLPRAIIYSLLICTILYVIISLVLTGMVTYEKLAVGDPLAYVFNLVHLDWVSGIIALTALIAMASVLLVFQVGQPRIWMSMSRDGLLPKIFSKIHPRFKTPSFSTIVTGLLVGIPAFFLNLTEVTDLTSIGTLFAFVVVCSGILFMKDEPTEDKSYRVPYINGKYWVPLLMLLITGLSYYFSPEAWRRFFEWHTGNGHSFFAWDIFKHKIPSLIFAIVAIVVTLLSFLKKLSLIPVLGLLSCLYLMSELGFTNWMRFLIWLLVGLIIYFSYGKRHSRLEVNNYQ
ncbi:MAG: amino acid permease [Saprospiraceae bacterium]|nr:amino acid permease [Lewinella sp.]